MKRIAACLLAVSALLGARAQAANLQLDIASADGPSWHAEGLQLRLRPPAALELDITRLAIAGRPPLRALQIRCTALVAGPPARCEHAGFAVAVPGWGRLRGTLSFGYRDRQHWNAALELPARGLRATLTQAGRVTRTRLALLGQPARALQTLASAFGFALPGAPNAELSGGLDLQLDAELSARPQARLQLVANALGYSEPSGRYAAEKLSATAMLDYDATRRHWQGRLDTQGGQAYAEPLFLDFDALPLHAEARVTRQPAGWDIERLQLDEGKAGQLVLSGVLGADYRPQQLDVQLVADDLAPLLATYLQPLVIGSVFDGLSGSGRASAQASLRDGALQDFTARLDGVGLKADRLGLALDALAGDVAWSATETRPSTLRWQGGAIRRVPFGASAIEFETQGRRFALRAPWRQPLLGGALAVETLALRDLGTESLGADFKAAVEPLDLAALCRALGWPEFGGTLAGKLPGLTVRDGVWAVDGALEAQAFDGRLRIERLRVMQPFGRLPEVTADVAIRRLDLDALTRAFSFGRISGRLDGDVRGLRLLNWSPVAFDARMYSTPGDDSTRRISQRAIDNISAIGGGPTGALSRGFMSLFKEFPYARLGIGCVLRDGVCTMSGVAPAPPQGELRGYTLVEGRLLPRINVVGYNERVSWPQLVEQLEAARASGGPKLK